jgi:ribosome-binding ATPase YchF (GTP1/OBG family)
VEALGAGRPARALPPPAAAPDALASLGPLTAKPVLYVANMAEEDAGGVPSPVAEHAAATGGRAVAIAARLEAELVELDDEEAVSMRRELGAPDEALQLLVREAFELLDLISFFTAAGERQEARARAVARGTTARRAAGTIHTDMERGFVRAEVVAWDELVAAGGYAAAREAGTLRTEGRDYELRDGEVMTVRFTT